jgi:hypothetical protein
MWNWGGMLIAATVGQKWIGLSRYRMLAYGD